MAKAFETD